MYRWSRNGHTPATMRWNGWAMALLGGIMGMLLTSAFWQIRERRQSKPQGLPPADLRRLGQAPSRSHIQLRSHPARQGQQRYS